MTARFSIAFWVIVAVQLVVLAGIVGFREQVRQTGERIVLQTVPVDPRSLLQGDYAILNYEVGGIPRRVEGAVPRLRDDLERGARVFVTLERQGDVWQATGYHRTRPRPGQLFITGYADGSNRLDFGIGTYFVPEGTGHIVERAQDVKVRVFIDRDGDAVIDDVLVDGVPFQEAVDSQR